MVALSAAAAEIRYVNMLASVFQLGCLQKRDSTDNSAIIFVWKFKIFDNMCLRLPKQNAMFNIKQLLQFISVVCHNAECLPFCEQGTHLPFGDFRCPHGSPNGPSRVSTTQSRGHLVR